MRGKLVGFLAVLVTMLASSTAWAFRSAPASFTLKARGAVSRGVTVKPVLTKQRTIGLVVFRRLKHTKVGTVPLGTYSGRPSIHWNLKVHGKLLGSGSYVISLRVFAHGKPTNTPGPRPRKLTITGQRVTVG
ncbi:MAG: hypothetical protein JO262_11315 [Solirubrobacterales bacterium]|nr:hypothetical protein [Solirubrobacterales bacterium]MBV9336268.1 hypothetical protein [Solirubrobacterales bacterium]MBV9942707.1 hypothetical protein [Solirubrobacterales bacterium]